MDIGPRSDRDVRYQPDERPPAALAFGMGAQQAVLCIAGVVLTPVIVIRAAGEGDPYLTWAVFAALLVSGLTTMMQAVRLGRIGAGYPLLMGTSGAFIAVCVTALERRCGAAALLGRGGNTTESSSPTETPGRARRDAFS